MLYTNAVFSAIAALKDPDCASIFSGPYSAADVLTSMVFGGTTANIPQGTFFGSVTADRLSLGFAAVTQPDPATSVNTGNGVKAGSAKIVLQDNPLSDAYWGRDTQQDLALTLIHELGHVFNIVNGLGSSKIAWDSNPDGSANQDAEDRNAKTLQQCHPK